MFIFLHKASLSPTAIEEIDVAWFGYVQFYRNLVYVYDPLASYHLVSWSVFLNIAPFTIFNCYRDPQLPSGWKCKWDKDKGLILLLTTCLFLFIDVLIECHRCQWVTTDVSGKSISAAEAMSHLGPTHPGCSDNPDEAPSTLCHSSMCVTAALQYSFTGRYLETKHV